MINELKTTGMIRRLDPLGRIVIPKEIRNLLHMKDKSPLEVYTNSKEEVVLRKYSAINNALNYADRVVTVLARILGLPVMISDENKILAVAGSISKKLYLDKRLSLEVDELIEERKCYSCVSDTYSLLPFEGTDDIAYMVVPIVSQAAAPPFFRFCFFEKITTQPSNFGLLFSVNINVK